MTKRTTKETVQEALRILGQALKIRKRDTRPSKTLRKPEEEFTDEWYMCVPKCFNDALDIKLTERKKGGKISLEWTQGSTFSFKAGNILYDTPKAYEPWAEALKHINCCIQIKEASEAIPGEKGAGESEGVPRNPGMVRIDVLIPSNNRSKLIKDREETMTQDEFVRLLIAGPSARTEELFE